MLGQLFAHSITTFFVVDLIMTAVMFILFSFLEAKRREIASWWLYLFVTLLVSPSFSFALFLFTRKNRIAGGEK